MKVKNETCLRSPLLRQNFKNSSDPNDRHWYATVPSITYIWTRKPLWRRRHKNRKKLNSHRFPLSLINSRVNEIDLWDTLELTGSRQCSRCSTSPYETCSSRPIVAESEIASKDCVQRNLEGFSLSSQRRQSFERKLAVCETRSDSGFRRGRTTQLVHTIRSQKRLGIRNSSNSQNTVGTLSSLEVNKSMQLSSVTRDTLSDFGIPKRRVTFSNYVSENSVTDTKSQIIATTNDDADSREVSWWQPSCDRLTDDDNDDDSLQTNLSCLFSSMIFDDSQSSFFSTATWGNSKILKKFNESSSTIDRCGECIFYVNAVYSNVSSCNLQSLPVSISRNNNDSKINEPSSENNRRDNNDDLTKINESREKRSDEKITAKDASDVKDIHTINTDLVNSSSIDCITVELRNISSTVKEVSIESANDSEKRRRHKSLSKNHISTDTNDLVVLDIVPTFAPIAEFLSKTDDHMNNANLKVNRIFEFWRQPKDPIDTDFLLKELSEVGARTFGNYNKKEDVGDVYEIRQSKIVRNAREEITDNTNTLRIDMDSYGDRDSIFIEMKDLGESVDDNEILKKWSSISIHNSLREGCGSMVVNLAEVSKHSELVESQRSNFHNDHEKCSTSNKCCLICGRKRTDNPRYLRPVCQVKGVIPTSRLENDPWMNVMNRVIKNDNGKKLLSLAVKTTEKDHQLVEELSQDHSNNEEKLTNELSPLVRNESGTVVERAAKECCGITIIGDENTSPSTRATVDASIASSREQSTSCPPEPDLCSSTSFGFATFRGLRTQSAKTYFMRESVKTAEGTANRLLCVISESDTLMAVPPFLSKKPPDWFARQIPTKKWSRR